MRPLWIGKYIVVNSLGKGRLKVQNADTRKKLDNTYHASNVKLWPIHADGSDETISHKGIDVEAKSSPKCQTSSHTKPVKRCRSNSSQEEPSPKRTKTTGARFNPIGRPQRQNIARALELTYEKAVYFSLSEELTRPRRIHKTRETKTVTSGRSASFWQELKISTWL